MPYQIIHTFEGFLAEPQLDGMTILLGRNEETIDFSNFKFRLNERLEVLKKGGVDGLIINIGGTGYFENPTSWEVFNRGLKECIDQGFKIWIYDEKGYPSGSAGGIVLKNNPQLEAIGIKKVTLKSKAGICEYVFREKGRIEILAYEEVGENEENIFCTITQKSYKEKFKQWEEFRKFEVTTYNNINLYYIGALYEGTHASRSFAEKRKYINLLDEAAVKRFIEITHEAYSQKVDPQYFNKVEAFFTDEPSVMSVVLGEVQDIPGQKIPVLDEVDLQVPLLPSMPYSDELKEVFEKKAGVNLEDIVAQLFEKTSKPSHIKYTYWQCMVDIYEKNFGKPLQAVCNKMNTKLTGHILSEETPFTNMIFHGNPFRILKHFDMPGTDLLSNELKDINIFAHKMPFSCAYLMNRNGIMSETSDFAQQRFGRQKAISKEKMIATLGMQYLLGVREYSYYYDFRKRSMEDYGWVNTIIKRTMVYGQEWEYLPNVAIYCPYETFWAWYVPTNLELHEVISAQNKEIIEADTNILSICKEMFETNKQFILVDESSLEQLIQHEINQVIMPKCDIIAKSTLDLVEQGKIILVDYKNYNDEQCIPFTYENGLMYATFKHNKYYIYNPTDSSKNIVLKNKAIVYNPFTDKKSEEIGQKAITIENGKWFFVEEISDGLD